MSSSNNNYFYIPIKIHQEPVCLIDLYKLPSQHRRALCADIIENMLSPREPSFVSYTSSKGEKSLVIEKRYLEDYIDMFFDPPVYKNFELQFTQSCVDEAGIVNEISGIFLNCDPPIPIVYINTYGKNFILIRHEDTPNAIDVLKENDFTFD